MAATSFLGHAVADNFRLWRSKTFAAPAAATYNTFPIPRYTFVREVYIHVVTAFGAGGSVTIGFSGNDETAAASYFMDDTMSLATETGCRAALTGKWFTASSGFLTVTTVSGASAGTFIVLMDCTIIR